MTDDDLLLSWDSICVWRAMLLCFDRSGRIDTRRGAQGLAVIIRAPFETVVTALPELVADGRVLVTETGYFAPNFMAAQEALKSDAQRQRDSREKRRTAAINRRQQVVRSDQRMLGFASAELLSVTRVTDPVTLCSASSANHCSASSASSSPDDDVDSGEQNEKRAPATDTRDSRVSEVSAMAMDVAQRGAEVVARELAARGFPPKKRSDHPETEAEPEARRC